MNGAPNPGPYLRPNLIDQIDKFEIYSRCILSQMNPEKKEDEGRNWTRSGACHIM